MGETQNPALLLVSGGAWEINRVSPPETCGSSQEIRQSSDYPLRRIISLSLRLCTVMQLMRFITGGLIKTAPSVVVLICAYTKGYISYSYLSTECYILPITCQPCFTSPPVTPNQSNVISTQETVF